VDMTFGFLTLAPLRSIGRMATMGDMNRQATDQMRGWMSGTSGGPGSDCGCSGSATSRPAAWSTAAPTQSNRPSDGSGQAWGPMPVQS
jgi:hypothetical protein